MASNLNSFDQSPAGAFIQSPLGARGVADSPVRVLHWASGQDAIATVVYLQADSEFVDPAFHVGLGSTILAHSRTSNAFSEPFSIDDYRLIFILEDTRFEPFIWSQIMAGWSGRVVLGVPVNYFPLIGYTHPFLSVPPGEYPRPIWINSISGVTGMSFETDRFVKFYERSVGSHPLVDGLVGEPGRFPQSPLQAVMAAVRGGTPLMRGVNSESRLLPPVQFEGPIDVHDDVTLVAENFANGVSWVFTRGQEPAFATPSDARRYAYNLYAVPPG